MNISKFFIVRPVATTLLMLALLFSGLLVWRLLPVSALPQVDYPIIQVYTFQPGTNPDTVQRTITAPLEREMGKIAGLKQMSSQSSVGASVITLQFELSAELGVVEQEVQSALSTASSKLPSDLPTPPVYRKVNPADVDAVVASRNAGAKVEQFVPYANAPKPLTDPGDASAPQASVATPRRVCATGSGAADAAWCTSRIPT